MALVQFLLSEKANEKQEITLSPEESFHLTKIHRLEAHDEILLLDGEGGKYHASILLAHEKRTLVRIHKKTNTPQQIPTLALAQSLVKSDKMELIIQKMTELGLSTIIPISTKHSIVDLKGKESRKRERWQKIADEALKQSGNLFRTEIREPISFEQMIKLPNYHKIHFCEKGGIPIKTALQIYQPYTKPILFIIGPEGGFSDLEIQQSTKHEIPQVHLGSRILRVETASIVAATLIQYELGQLHPSHTQ